MMEAKPLEGEVGITAGGERGTSPGMEGEVISHALPSTIESLDAPSAVQGRGA